MAKKNALETVLDMIKELPTSSRIAALAALGSSTTLLMAGNAAAGMLKIHNQVQDNRWFWEDHNTLALQKMAELNLLKNPQFFQPGFRMIDAKSMRFLKRNDWYSNFPLFPGSTSELRRPTKIAGSAPLIYLALGDSAAQGVGVSNPQESYVALFASYLRRATRRRILLLNLSISGAISSTVINSQLPWLQLLGCKPDFITLDIGGNDTFCPEEISEEDFAQNMQIIVDSLPSQALILEVPSVHPLPQDKRAKKLNQALLQIVEETEHVAVPIHSLTEVPLWRSLTIRAEDGFHPNTESYRLAALQVARCCEPLLKARGLWHDTADTLY